MKVNVPGTDHREGKLSGDVSRTTLNTLFGVFWQSEDQAKILHDNLEVFEPSNSHQSAKARSEVAEALKTTLTDTQNISGLLGRRQKFSFAKLAV